MKYNLSMGKKSEETAIDSLPNQDQLFHAIGQVAQEHVQMERELRAVHMALCSPSPAINLSAKARGVQQLMDDVRTMLRSPSAGLPKHLIDAAFKVLSATKDANEERHRTVHDWWMNMTNSKEDGEFSRLELQKDTMGLYKVTHHDIKSIREIRSRMYRVRMRIWALRGALLNELPFHKSSSIKFDLDFLAMMNDKFTILETGGFKIESERSKQ